MSEPWEPDWSLLPDQPAAFFQLPQDYDRKTLKRAYNRAIKRFKPDRDPESFQRIREAYEHLDNIRRYGSPPQESIIEEGGEPPSSGPGDVPLSINIPEDQCPIDFYHSLVADGEKRAEVYIALALTGDVLEREERGDDLTHPLFYWLVMGLNQHPEDPGLAQMLFECCRDANPPEDAADILLLIAERIGFASYYQFTEQLWLQLLDQTDFDTWRTHLDRCHGCLHENAEENRTAFLAYCARRFLFKADLTWLEELFISFDTEHESLPEYLEQELTFLDLLLQYRRQLTPVLLDGTPLAIRMHQMVRRYCETEDWQESFIMFQRELSQKPQELAEAIPYQENYSLLYAVYEWISDELTAPFDGEWDYEPGLKERVSQLTGELERRNTFDRYHLLRDSRLEYLLLTGGLMILLVVILKWERLTGVFLGALLIQFILRKLVKKPYLSWHQWLFKKTYTITWRPVIMHYLEQEAMPMRVLVQTLDELPEAYAEQLQEMLRQDHAMWFYAKARGFVV